MNTKACVVFVASTLEKKRKEKGLVQLYALQFEK